MIKNFNRHKLLLFLHAHMNEKIAQHCLLAGITFIVYIHVFLYVIYVLFDMALVAIINKQQFNSLTLYYFWRYFIPYEVGTFLYILFFFAFK